jgi:hypothetical protein
MKNWSEFLNTKNLFSTALSLISATTFSIVKTDKLPEGNSVKLSVSQLNIVNTGLRLWIDFLVPKDNAVTVGTIDCFVSWEGQVTIINIVGTTLTSA